MNSKGKRKVLERRKREQLKTLAKEEKDRVKEEGNEKERLNALALKALSQLLQTFFLHPLLWPLYNTCKTLYVLKPLETKTRYVQKIKVKKFFMRDDVSVVEKKVDGIFYSKSEPSFAYVVRNGEYYIIPKEWISFFYIDHDERFALHKEKFCCRLNVYKYDQVRILMNQPLYIPEGIKITKDLFHIGVSECDDEFRTHYAGIPIPVGMERLIKVVEENGMNKHEFFCILQVYKKELLKMLKHILLCENCCDKLIKFIYKCLSEYKYNDDDLFSINTQYYVLNCPYNDYYSKPIKGVSCAEVESFLS